jgi:NAD-dependent SIR2 family protein deacetylase
MLKATTSFPSVIYENDERPNPPGRAGRVAEIMAKYYARIEEIIQAEIKKQNEMAGKQPADNAHQSAEKTDIQESINIIRQSRQKVKQISSDFNRTDDDMKKLEREGQILRIVRKNLDTISHKYFGE